MTNAAYDASQRMHNMAGEVGDKRVGYLLTGLSVALVAAMVIKELRGAFRDEFREWEKHHERHEGKKTHAERARESQGHGRER